MPAPGESDSQLNLRELVSHPHVVEVLDALSHGPMTLAEISSIVSARRRVLARRCGLLPPRGLVTRNHTGSWDTDAPVAAVYRHTELGRLVARILDVPLGNYVSSVYTASADWRVESATYRVVGVQPTAGSRGRGTRVRCRHSRP